MAGLSFSRGVLGLVALTTMAALPALAFAAATPFTFDPSGTAGATGDIGGLGAFDQSPGNVLRVGAVGAQVGSTSTLLYQANLGTLNDANGNGVFLNGAGGDYFTFVAGFNEIVSSVTSVAGTQTVTFGKAPTGPNFFYMYATVAPGNNLAGTGFTSGAIILAGTINQTNFSSSFTTNVAAPAGFDQFQTDNYPGVTSVTGRGATSLDVTITSFDPLYFPSFSGVGQTLAFFNTSQVAPFQQVDPSAAFSSNGIANGDFAANRGAVNGVSGPNFQFQADANTSFQAAIPEPSAVMLGALGFLGFMARRKPRG